MELKALSVLAVLFIALALWFRSNNRIHIPLMLLAFAIDMGLLLHIETSRSAIEQVAGPMPAIMVIHLFFSIGTVTLYPVQIIGGAVKFFRGGVRFHLWTGLAFALFRLGNLITSFLIPTHNLVN